MLVFLAPPPADSLLTALQNWPVHFSRSADWNSAAALIGCTIPLKEREQAQE